jgi:hypothetical protein
VGKRSVRVLWIEGHEWPEPPGAVIVPEGLRVVGARLEDGGALVRCEYGVSSVPPPWGEAFRRFLRLDGAPPARVRDFVARFGPLGVGADGLPRLTDWVPVRDAVPLPGHKAERVAWYGHYAALLAAALRLALCVRAGLPAERDDMQGILDHWQLVQRQVTLGRPHVTWVRDSADDMELCLRDELLHWDVRGAIRTEAEIHDERNAGEDDIAGWMTRSRPAVPLEVEAVRAVVNWWLAMGETYPVLIRDGREPKFTFGWNGGLWGALGLHLLFAVQGARGGSLCAGCGRFVRHQRAPKRGQRVWCKRLACRRRQYRDAQARSRGARSATARPTRT